MVPDVINYLLSLKYPSSELGRTNWVCYRGGTQVIIPLFPPGTTINFTARPLNGVYAWFGYATRFGADMVPDAFTGTVAQYGTTPYSGTLSQINRDDPLEYFVLVTEQEPTYFSLTNISPLTQRFEILGDFIVIPSPTDLKTVMDALRRLHTSSESENLLQQAVYLLGVLSGQPQEPRPSLGGS